MRQFASLCLSLLALLLVASRVASQSLVIVSSPVLVPNPDGNGNWGNTPDGKMSVVSPSPNTSDYIVFTNPNVRNLSPTQYVEQITSFDPTSFNYGTNFVVLSGHSFDIYPGSQTGLRGAGDCYDNMCPQSNTPYNFWFMSIMRLSETSGWSAQPYDLIAFVHNEDHYFDISNTCAWRSMAVSYSHDLGITWERSVPVLTAQTPQPDQPCPSGNGGLGDMTVNWDGAKGRWVAVYPGVNGQLSLAQSFEPSGKPGSWTKYNPQTGETSPGFAGTDFAIPALQNYGGSNPSIIWDYNSQIYLMIYKNWGQNLLYTFSTDLDNWTSPLPVPGLGTEAWYPTLIGSDSRYTTDSTATLYYADFSSNPRNCMRTKVAF